MLCLLRAEGLQAVYPWLTAFRLLPRGILASRKGSRPMISTNLNPALNLNPKPAPVCQHQSVEDRLPHACSADKAIQGLSFEGQGISNRDGN